jgi:hypothetical protein
MLSCPEAVPASTEFEVTIGLSPTPPKRAASTRMSLPKEPRVELVVTLIPPPGCALRKGERARNTLVVTEKDPFPKLTLHLRARRTLKGELPIGATFALRGEVIGAVIRTIAIGSKPGELQQLSVKLAPGGDSPPDLTVTILRPDQSSGKLRWSYETPHPEARDLLPDIDDLDIGAAAPDFARKLMQKFPATETANAPALLRLQFQGVARMIAAKVPKAFFEAVHLIGTTRNTAPSILFLSQEPHVPWELMAFERKLDQSAPPILGAQADVGRWVLDGPPPGPAPTRTRTGPMVVLSGGEGLEQSLDEAFTLQEEYSAKSMEASVDHLLTALGSTPPFHFLHLSVHGSASGDPTAEGLDLKGLRFDETAVRGLSTLAANPFIFLNACEVGQSTAVLGSYAGLAAAFTYVGASGIVAPLWKIRDGIARSVVLRFYQAVSSGIPVAAALREVRKRFADPGSPASATYLAFQFFGHPGLKLGLARA